MAYIPDPTNASQPVDTVKASAAAAEFRSIKAYLNSVVAAGLPPIAGQDGNALVVEAGVIKWGSVGNPLYNFQNFV